MRFLFPVKTGIPFVFGTETTADSGRNKHLPMILEKSPKDGAMPEKAGRLKMIVSQGMRKRF